jgi:hypothetical protein
MPEHLEAQGWRGSVQGYYAHRPTHRLIQNDAKLQRPCEHICCRQLDCKKNGYIHVPQCMGLVPRRGAE